MGNVLSTDDAVQYSLVIPEDVSELISTFDKMKCNNDAIIEWLSKLDLNMLDTHSIANVQLCMSKLSSNLFRMYDTRVKHDAKLRKVKFNLCYTYCDEVLHKVQFGSRDITICYQ